VGRGKKFILQILSGEASINEVPSAQLHQAKPPSALSTRDQLSTNICLDFFFYSLIFALIFLIIRRMIALIFLTSFGDNETVH